MLGCGTINSEFHEPDAGGLPCAYSLKPWIFYVHHAQFVPAADLSCITRDENLFRTMLLIGKRKILLNFTKAYQTFQCSSLISLPT